MFKGDSGFCVSTPTWVTAVFNPSGMTGFHRSAPPTSASRIPLMISGPYVPVNVTSRGAIHVAKPLASRPLQKASASSAFADEWLMKTRSVTRINLHRLSTHNSLLTNTSFGFSLQCVIPA